MIRITGGKFKGRILKAPKGQKVRPTRSMVREAIFNMIGPEIQGATVLDLFSGSGLLGLEAKSRGARQVFFVEQDKATCKLLRDNLSSLSKTREDPILCTPVHRALKQLGQAGIKFDFILMDPPYAMGIDPLLNTLSSTGIVKPGGWIVVEREKTHDISSPPKGFTEVKRKTYGVTTVHIFQLLNPKKGEV